MPGLWSGPVCLTVIWCFSWSLWISCAQILTDEVSDVHYGRLESNVTLACGKSQMRTPVVWHLNHSSALPWHRVAPDGSLVLLHVDHSAQGNYSCYDDRGLLFRSVSLRLGRPPGLQRISCRVPSHSQVRCSWVEDVKTFLPSKYNASFRGTTMEWVPCLVDVLQKHCDVVEPAFWQTHHFLRVTQTNALGSKTTLVQVKLHELLTPDPPESLMGEGVEGYPKRLIIEWNFPSSWPMEDPFPLIFHIRYRPQGSMFWSEIYSENNSVEIFDAMASHPHQVQVRARDGVNSESIWSEWSALLSVSPWEENNSPEPDTDFPPVGVFPAYFLPTDTEPESFTEKAENLVRINEGKLGLWILLILFSLVMVTTILSLVFVVWLRHKRRDQGTKQELTSMVKMKSVPI